MTGVRTARPFRVAIVGSTSPVGQELCELIEETAPAWEMTRLEVDEYAGLIEEFSGQIEIVQVIPPERLAAADVVVFACSPSLMQAYLDSGAYRPPATIDLSGGDRPGPVFVSGVTAGDPRTWPAAPMIAPRAETIVLTRLLRRLHEVFGVEACDTTVLEPVSERGREGIQKLQEDTIEVLNFKDGGAAGTARVAFNVTGPDASSARRSQRIARQIGALCDRCPAPALQFGGVPVFQGSVFSVHIRLGRETSEAEILETWNDDRSAGPRSSSATSPVEVIGSNRIHLSRVDEGADLNSFWLWIVVDNLRLAAENALALIRSFAAVHSSA